MLIQINSVDVAKAEGKSYNVATVGYEREGKPEVKKIMDFAAKEVFNQLQAMRSFPVNVNVVLKKEGTFWNWVKIETAETSGNVGRQQQPQAGRVVGSNYETSEERARKQVYIVRQSSISAAIEVIKARNPKGIEIEVNEVISIARRFEDHVFSIPSQKEVI